MHDHLEMLSAWCGSAGGGGGLLLAMLTAGLVGSVVHCAPMCGPFVLAQVSDRLARVPAARLCERQRVAAGMLLPYHAGRLTTYAALGAAAAGSGEAIARLPMMGWLPGALLLTGAALFIAQAVRRLAPRWHPFAGLAPRGGAAGPAAGAIASLVRRIDRTRPVGGFYLGVVLGFLPCGFLYAALAVASAAGGPARGALAMAAFGLGTVPGLAVIGIAGHAAGRSWARLVAAAGPPLLLFNATVLLALAWQRF